ncbi:MAG: HAMP domain-containing protein [Magnetococcales bacterium]|nr:HAMP domain-containing protein [Magnetococcales bacterium]
MKSFFNNLRIGEKIGFGFGIVGLLYLLVIFQYHTTLNQALERYQTVHRVFEAKKGHALQIGLYLEQARRGESDFILHRIPIYSRQVESSVNAIMQESEALSLVDQEGKNSAKQIDQLIKRYLQNFHSIVKAWEVKGLDHNSGLQGKFRETAHELEAQAALFKVDSLYLQLLQIRRREKDLGLRLEPQYRDQVMALIEEFRLKIAASGLDHSMKNSLNQETALYQESFKIFVIDVLDQHHVDGGKGPFRQAAHRIEDLLLLHRVPDLGKDILQLRRREKDYLLRGDEKYVQWALRELETIRKNITRSTISSSDKDRLILLTQAYQTDFLALVKQNEKIDDLSREMRKTVAQIVPQVERNVIHSEEMMSQVVKEIHATTSANNRLMLWIVLVASMLGIILAWIITRRITRPLHQIGATLGQLSHEDPADRLPFFGGRNELDAMAGAVNTLADHQKITNAWHRASYRFDNATLCRDVLSQSNPETILAAEQKLHKTRESRNLLSGIIRDEINTLMDGILHEVDKSFSKERGSHNRNVRENIRCNAKAILDIVEIISGFPDTSKEYPSVVSEPFDISELIDTLANFFREYARKKNVAFKVGIPTHLPTPLIGDAGQLRLILVNLLSNAVKFTEKGEVCFDVEVLEVTGRRVELLFLIRDTGIGMSADDIATLFGPFTELNTNRIGKYQRPGQGLAMTRQVVQLLNGQINVESSPGSGSTFTVALPMETSS